MNSKYEKSSNNELIRYGFNVLKKDFLIFIGRNLSYCFNAPYTINVVLTRSCNARCIMCNSWKDHRSNELDISQWKKIIQDLRSWIGPHRISFSGGEPFLKEGFLELLKYCSDRKIRPTVLTNGSFFDENRIPRILDSGVANVIFSLYSKDPGVHDRYKGIPGLHQKVVSAIRMIKQSRKPVRVGVLCVVTKDNYNTLSDFSDWVQGLGIDSIDFGPIRDALNPEGHALFSSVASPSNPLWQVGQPELLDQQIDLLLSKKKAGYPIVTPASDLISFKSYFRGPSELPSKGSCEIGFRNLIIMPDGDIMFCFYYPPIGNIRNGTIRKTWYSSEAQKQRKILLHCMKPCVSGCLREFSLRDKIFQFFHES